MNPIYLNAALLPLFATIFFPDAIRDKNSGEFLGFYNVRVVAYFVAIFLVELILLSDRLGFSYLTLLRVIAISLLPLLGGIVFAIYSHKHNFGEELNFRNKKN